MTQYAANTSVSVENSKMEIERLLRRYGASKFASGWDETRAVVNFEAHKRLIKFVLPLPPKEDYGKTDSGRQRHNAKLQEKAWEQGCRSRWRALALIIKAKLEAVESGITSFEQEFAVHVVLPGGGTVGEWILPQIDEAYVNGKMPKMLLGMGT
jgi:hypothetical protein